MKRLVRGAAIVVFFVATSMRPTTSADEFVTLAALESRLDDNVRLAAERDRIEVAHQDARFELAKRGADIFAESAFGPRHEPIANGLMTQSVRYEQSVGVRLPLFGRKAAQNEAIAAANASVAIDEANYVRVRRATLATLRSAYIQYWGAVQREVAIQTFSQALFSTQKPSRILLAHGFWTDADYLAYLDRVATARAAEKSTALERETAFTQLREIVGPDLQPFRPAFPDFGMQCSASPERTTALAVEDDPEMTQIRAQLESALLARRYAKWRSVDASVQAGVGTLNDFPGGMGYHVTVALNVSMPQHHRAADDANIRRIEAQIAQYRTELDARSNELSAGVTEAIEARDVAMAELPKTMASARAHTEELRTSQVRFHTIATQSLTDVQTAISSKFDADVRVLTAQTAIMLRANDILALAPAACSAVPKTVYRGGDALN